MLAWALLQGRHGDSEFEKRKPGEAQLKYYARGVGNVRVGYLGNDSERTLEFGEEGAAQSEGTDTDAQRSTEAGGTRPPSTDRRRQYSVDD